MPKKKYVYANKKLLLNKCILENEDKVFYISPFLAKKIGEKFNMGKDVEEKFKLYFEGLHVLGISPLLDARKIRRDVINLQVGKYAGLDSRYENAVTDVSDETIVSIRKSFRNSEFSTLFHEMNHVFSKYNFSKVNKNYQRPNDPFFEENEIQHKIGFFYNFKNNENDNYNLFDEGVTEYLAKRLEAYVLKRDVAYHIYSFYVQFARMFYLLAGNTLFDEYFNNGDFSKIAKEIGVEDVTEKEVRAIAYFISQVDNQQLSLSFEAKQLLFNNMISLFTNKVEGIVWNNLESFKDAKQIEKLIGNAFSNFAQTFFFGMEEKCVDQLLRPAVFGDLTDYYFKLVEVVNEEIVSNGFAEKYGLINLENKTYEGICEFFKFVNNRNYGIIIADEKPLTLENLLGQEKVSLYGEAKGNFIRKKEHFGNPIFMERFGEATEILESIIQRENAKQKFEKPSSDEFEVFQPENDLESTEQNEADFEM